MSKQEVPAVVHYQATGELQEVDYNWLHLMQTCQQALQTERQYVILPVREEQSTKRNRVRLDKKDKASPKGLILKTDKYAQERYYPYAAARFKAEELAKYCAERFNNLSPDELQRMVANIGPDEGDTPDLQQLVSGILQQRS